MKVFEIPEIQVSKFELEDIITTSEGGDDLDYGENQTPPAARP